MHNLGKAHVKVDILNALPGVSQDNTKYNFDVTAFQWDTMQNSPYFPPFLADFIGGESEGFGAIIPSKRKKYIDNYITYADGTINANAQKTTSASDTASITFKAISRSGVAGQGVVSDILNPVKSKTNPDPYTDYTLEQPQQDGKYSTDYIGPKWEIALNFNEPPPNDFQAISNFLKFLGNTKAAQTWEQPAPTSAYRYWLNQHVVRDGLWWGLESSPFLYENMPFYVNLRIMRTPSSANHPTQFIISLGIDDDTQAYDIVLSTNCKPKIVDYYLGRKNKKQNTSGEQDSPEGQDTGPSNIVQEFDSDLSRLLDSASDKDIEVGIMTVAGRLMVTVGGTSMIYTRVEKKEGDEHGTVKECKIAKGKIRLWGTNVQTIINVCPMTFAPLAALALPLPSFTEEATTPQGDGEAPPKPIKIVYKGVDTYGRFVGSIAVLPQQPDKKGLLYGVDCSDFIDASGVTVVKPTGVGMHRQGTIYFVDAGSVGVTELPSSDFYILVLRSSNTFINDTQFPVPFGGCPYFFKIKGGYAKDPKPPQVSVLAVPEVISASQSITTNEYFSATSNMSITIYNKGGKYDFLSKKQYGIRVYFGWQSKYQQVFTGVIVSTSSSESPGKETLTLQCEDYTHLLKTCPIINSPFYDGMVAFYALVDLGHRAGITTFINEMKTQKGEADRGDYFLPSGYTFSQPKVKYPPMNKIYDCMIDIIKRFEAYMYFNPFGQMVINKLPGGLFSEASNFAAEFTRNPDADPNNIILNEKNIETTFADTFNKISMRSVDRDTRNIIIYGKAAKPNENNLMYRKVNVRFQSALGDMETTKTWTARLAKRIFWPIKKTTISTIGSISPNNKVINVLDFVKVDGQEFRITSITRKYDANSNDFMLEYGMEWLGGKQGGR